MKMTKFDELQDKLVLSPVACTEPSRSEVMQRVGFVRWLSILLLLALALLPTLAMAAPSPSPLWLGPTGLTAEETSVARQGPTVRIDPAQSIVGAGKTFNISVMIEEANDLGGFELTLLFVATTVKVDSVTVGDFPGSTGREAIAAVNIIDNQAGTVSLGVVTVGSAPGASGTGVLATVTLTAQGSGESFLNLQDVTVLDTNAQRQTTTVEDGVVRVGFAIYLPLILKDW